MSENKCLESGCPGLCCWDTDIEVTDFERKRLFPKAVHLKSLKELRQGPLEKGFCYYAKLKNSRLGLSGFSEVGWVGPCVNQLPNGDCGKYDERAHAGRNFRYGSKECNIVRLEHGLKPV